MTTPPYPEEIRPSNNGPGPFVSLGGVTPIEPVYIERPLLQAATFHLFAGKLGVGKGAIIMRWLARCTNGEMYGKPRNALLLASEEDNARDLFPRIKVAGGDPNRVTLIPHNFLLPRDIEWLRESALEIGDMGLVALDPLSNHIQGTNSNADEEVRNALQPLAILAGDIDVLMIGVRHVTSKEVSGGFIARILGSSAWPAVPRVVIGVAKDEEGALHVRALKGNRLRYEDAGVRYQLVSAQFLDWQETVVKAVEDGESMVDIDSLLGKAKRSSASETARHEVVRILREAGGQLESDVLDGRVAEAAGVSARTVRDLRMELRDRGWIRHIRFDKPDGAVDHWEVALTAFAPLDDPDANPSNQGFSSPAPPTSFPSNQEIESSESHASGISRGFTPDSPDLQDASGSDVIKPCNSPEAPHTPGTPDSPSQIDFWGNDVSGASGASGQPESIQDFWEVKE